MSDQPQQTQPDRELLQGGCDKSQFNKLLLESAKRPAIHRVQPPTQLLSRLQHFLPKLAKANEQLTQRPDSAVDPFLPELVSPADGMLSQGLKLPGGACLQLYSQTMQPSSTASINSSGSSDDSDADSSGCMAGPSSPAVPTSNSPATAAAAAAGFSRDSIGVAGKAKPCDDKRFKEHTNLRKADANDSNVGLVIEMDLACGVFDLQDSTAVEAAGRAAGDTAGAGDSAHNQQRTGKRRGAKRRAPLVQEIS